MCWILGSAKQLKQLKHFSLKKKRMNEQKVRKHVCWSLQPWKQSTIIWIDKEDWAEKQIRSLPSKKFTYNPGPSHHTCEKNPIIEPGIQKQYFFKNRNVGKPLKLYSFFCNSV